MSQKYTRKIRPLFRKPNKEYHLIHRAKLKADILEHYGDSCVGCGTREGLTIDHINNDGAKHRKSLNPKKPRVAAGTNLYRWLRMNNYPDGLQTMCMQCQFLKQQNKGQLPISCYSYKNPMVDVREW